MSPRHRMEEKGVPYSLLHNTGRGRRTLRERPSSTDLMKNIGFSLD